MKLILYFFFSFILITAMHSCKRDSLSERSTTNQPPLAKAGFSQIITLPKDSVYLDGTNSIDFDGTITSYKWSKFSGPDKFKIFHPDLAKTLVNKLTKGVYIFELTVTDNGGLSSKDTLQIIVEDSTTNITSNVAVSCDNRPVINARLVPIGSLSVGRIGLVSATAGNKILFAGGMSMGAYSSRVDIYDITNNSWSTAELSKPERQGMAVATIGNKIFFAGGGDNDNGFTTSRVDIYDALNNTWTTAELSKAREFLTATTLGNQIFFAGGGAWEPNLKGSTIVDIYDNISNSWSTASLSEARMDHTATVAGNKIYFAGGTTGYYTSLSVIKSIDIYDGVTKTWSTSSLQEPKMNMASISVGNKIFWSSGFIDAGLGSGFTLSNKAEIKDLNTGISSFSCVLPRVGFDAVLKDDNIVFFTGNIDQLDNKFEIYNLTNNTWSTAVLNKKISDATIISVNNTVYVAGGRDNAWGPYFSHVYKLEF
jgi:hypothetical protein